MILEKSVTFSKSFTTLSKTGSSPSSIPNFLSNLVISGTFLAIYLIHSVILRELWFLLGPDFFVALASLITYYLSLIRVRLSSATFILADSFFQSDTSSWAETNFYSSDVNRAAVVWSLEWLFIWISAKFKAYSLLFWYLKTSSLLALVSYIRLLLVSRSAITIDFAMFHPDLFLVIEDFIFIIIYYYLII